MMMIDDDDDDDDDDADGGDDDGVYNLVGIWNIKIKTAGEITNYHKTVSLTGLLFGYKDGFKAPWMYLVVRLMFKWTANHVF